MFYGELKEENTVTINDLNPQGFQGMKFFFYTGKVNFTSAVDALLTLAAAQKYLVSELSKKCTEYITKEKIQPSEVLKFYENCKIYHISEFDELCNQVIREETRKVVDSEYFSQAKIETIEVILKSSPLNLISEIKLFSILKKWAIARTIKERICDHDVAIRFNSLKKYIRFLTMSSEDFVSEVADSSLLTEEEKTAIAWNLLKPGSKPLPETLSSELQYRESTISSKQQEKYKFTLSVDNLTSIFDGYTLPKKLHPDLILKITCSKINNFICFWLEPLTKIISKRDCCIWLVTMRSKLRVVANDVNNDFWLENTCSVRVDWKKQQQQTTIFAKIEVRKLKKKCFLKDTKDSVDIEGFFYISAY
ncbi:uncharacterized protein LOC111064191 isoform X1 [Nilaparvata lugens]|uniref:uncharacterized protein LOC111064191 isoform X1 n=1 Tax=Nilaparvata lugens TaxID=108931 RepID=UPI00193E4084|nr:uncharacterized protein LOC111064191 isoform X1 [Nilaparvata lugens]